MTRVSLAKRILDMHNCRPLVVTGLMTVLLLAATRNSLAQLPAVRLHALFPPGAQQGQTVDASVTSGADLEDVSGLHFSHPGITATQKTAEPSEFQTGPQPLSGQFQVTVAADVPPGVYDVRAVGKYGISNPRSFVVGDRAELLEQEGNNTLSEAQEVALGSVVNGTSDGEAADCFKVTLAAGQRLLVDCWADRIDSRMDPTLVLYSAEGVELERDRDSRRLDPLLDFTAPADGQYIIKLHDFTYQGGNDHFYRLAVGPGAHIDYVMPPAGAPGSTGQFVLYGRNLPGGTPVEGSQIDGRPLEQLTVEIALPGDEQRFERLSSGGVVMPEDSMLDGFDYRLSTPEGVSNPVFIGFSTAPVALETEPNDAPEKAQILALPTEVAAQFYPQRDRDYFRFEAKGGDVFWIEVFSQRLGLPTDPFVLVQRVTKNAEGVESFSDVQQLDDHNKDIGGKDFNTPTQDAVYRFSAPDDGVYQILVRDLYSGSRADPRLVYRLSIRTEQPDFRLVAAPIFPTKDNNQTQPWTPLLRRGGSETIRVMAFRLDSFGGPIDVAAESLPEGVSAAPVTIGPGMDAAHLVLTASEVAPAWAGEIKIVGRARIGDADVVRNARGGGVVWPGQRNQAPPIRSRMTRNLAIAVSGQEASPFALALDRQVWETSRAGKLQIPVKVIRRGDFKGNLALSAVDVPGEFKPKNVTINGDASEGTFEIELTPKAPLGTFTLALQAETQVPYSRNPEAAAAAEQEKQRLEALTTELAAASAQAETAKQTAEQTATQSAATAEKLVTALATAKQGADEAAAQAKAASEKVEQAKAATTSQTGNQELVDTLAAAEKATAEANQKLAVIIAALGDAQAATADVKATADAAATARDAAQKAAEESAAKAKRAAEAKDAAAKRAGELAEAAKPKDVNVYTPVVNITVKVAAAPLNVSATAPDAALKPSSQIEIPLEISRLYGFADAVQIEAVLPKEADGLKAANIDVPADQSTAKIVITSGDQPKPGSYSLLVRAKLKFNGQDLQVEQTVPFQVTPAD